MERTEERSPRGHYSRGYLPHIDWPTIQFLTFRLADSLPTSLLECWRTELSHLSEKERERAEYRRVEAYINLSRGKCWLRRRDVAETFEAVLFEFVGRDVEVYAWVVMPNHIHLLAGIPRHFFLGEFMKQLKGKSARECNKVLGRSGTFWFREYYDRYIRNQEHFDNTLTYIQKNPVAAGLCKAPEDWTYSSASNRGVALLARCRHAD